MSIHTKEQFVYAVSNWIELAYPNHKSAAKELGVSEQYLSDFLRGKRNPGAKLLRGLKAKRIVTYRWGA